MHRIAPVLLLAACTDEDPCQEYVDYMCQCHAGDTGVDCAALQVEYADPSTELQDHCAIALDEQVAEDEADGLVCPAETGAAR